MFQPVLTRNIQRPNSEKIAAYLAHGGYAAAKLALSKPPEELIEMVKRSGLRGRGGAGFPAGVKWGFMPKGGGLPKVVAVNTDEGEPGTFKDREIVERDPHQVIEGVLIAAYAVGASQAYVTLACIPHIIERGPEWFASLGTAESKGPKIFSVSGHVERPGNYELPLGVTLREVIYEHAGGIKGGRQIKAIIPGGASTPMLTAAALDVPMAFETLKQAGSELGTGAIIVMDESTCMVEAARRLTKFFAHESCGRCVPCRVGATRLYETLDRLEHGQGAPGDVERALELAEGIDGRTFCPMGAALVNPSRSAIAHFRDEFEYHIRQKQCHVPRS